jgi:hypothetical protein
MIARMMNHILSVTAIVLLVLVVTGQVAGNKWRTTRGAAGLSEKMTPRHGDEDKNSSSTSILRDNERNGVAREVKICTGGSGEHQQRQLARPSKCGGAVNAGAQNCDPMLWSAVSNMTMPCFAYGGPNDPCALNINNDINHGMDKDPSNCIQSTSKHKIFYLWDEPDTQGRGYIWAGYEWLQYSQKFSKQIMDMRRNHQFQFTSPLIRADRPAIDIANFYKGCNPPGKNFAVNPCEDPNDPAYINIIAGL